MTAVTINNYFNSKGNSVGGQEGYDCANSKNLTIQIDLETGEIKDGA